MQQEFISPTDQGALLALNSQELLEQAKSYLAELGYKTHVAFTHEDFNTAFSQFEYKLIILDEQFASNSAAENESLQQLQKLPMNARRHATIILVGNNFQTLNSMQAFTQSVHAVLNISEFASLPQFLQKIVADNALFLHTYRESQRRLIEGKT